MNVKWRSKWIFVFCMAVAMVVQTLLLIEGQCHRLQNALREDFRVVFFLRGPLEEAKRVVLEERLRTIPEASQVRYVSPDESLKLIKQEDPEIADSIALVSENPLPGAFEITPSLEVLTRLASFIDGIEEMADWSDVRWKPAQLQAILRVQLYNHWIKLILSSLLCLTAALTLTALFSSLDISYQKHKQLGLTAAAGALLGLMLAVLMAWPLRRDGMLWLMPAWWTQVLVLISCLSIGWSLSLWHDEA